MSLVLELIRQLHAKHLETCLLHSEGSMYLPACMNWMADPQKHWTCICLSLHSASSVGDSSFLYAIADQKYPCPFENKDRLLHSLGDSGPPFSVCFLWSAVNQHVDLNSGLSRHSHRIPEASDHVLGPLLHWSMSFFLFLGAVLHIRDHISNLFLLHPDFQPYLFLVLHKYLIFF